jgi:pSer/pThr/pTyr-binding forkhead associated (FHA) protein
MAKLYLKFEQQLLKEYTLSQGSVTVGRLPDNFIQVDNLAVSGHHARIFFDTDHYVVEDNNSLNGTFVNKQRVTRAVLNDGDEILIGKHHIEFKDEWHEDMPAAQPTQPVDVGPALPKLQETMMLDTRKAKEMMEKARAAAGGAPAAPAPAGEAPAAAEAAPAEPVRPPRERVGVLTVLEGKTDETQYHLAGKLTVIGKSEMASVRLKGWFAPKVAAQITKREGKYTVGAGDASAKLRVNGQPVAGHAELNDSDVIEVAGVKFSFTLAD